MINSIETDLRNSATIFLETYFDEISNMSILVLVDEGVDSCVQTALRDAITGCGGDCILVSTHIAPYGIQDLPRCIAAALCGADAIIAASWFHPTLLRIKAVWRAIYEYGVPWVHIDPPHKEAILSANKIMRQNDLNLIRSRLDAILRRSSFLRVLQKKGETLDIGIAPEKTRFSANYPVSRGSSVYPPGVCAFDVIPGQMNGTITVDTVDGIPGRIEPPLFFEIQNGVITGFNPEELPTVLIDMLGSESGWEMNEAGIGVNPNVKFDEMVSHKWHETANRSSGTLHFGIGSTPWDGGSSAGHVHLAVRDETVIAMPNNHPIIESGKLVILS